MVISLGAILGFAAGGCNTAAPAPYYSSRRDLLGQPAPTKTPSNSISQRLSGPTPGPPSNPDTIQPTNSPPPQTQSIL